MPAPNANWTRAQGAIRDLADLHREILTATITDVAHVADSWVLATVEGVTRRVLWPDGPDPTVGQQIQVWRTSHRGSADWLALQIPQPNLTPPPPFCPDYDADYLISAKSLADGSWKILHCHWLRGTPIWTIRADHPAASGDDRPLWNNVVDFITTPLRWWTYGVGDALYYSDDGGFTWTKATGSDGITYVYENLPTPQNVTQHALAVTPSSILRSDDFGLSWHVAYGADPAGGTWRYASTLSYSVFAGNAPESTIRSSEWEDYNTMHFLISTAGAQFTINDWDPYNFPDVNPYGHSDPGTYIDPGTGIDRPPLYGYYPFPGGVSAGRHLFVPTDGASSGTDIGCIFQANGDVYTYADPGPFDGGGGGELSGAGLWQINGSDMISHSSTYTNQTAALYGTNPSTVHPVKDGQSIYSNGLLIADRPDGNGYGLYNFAGRQSGNNWIFVYDNARNHPTHKSGVGLRDTIYDTTCVFAALGDTDPAACQFAFGTGNLVVNDYVDYTSPPNYMDGTFHDLSAAMLTQLGAKFVASHGGVTQNFGLAVAPVWELTSWVGDGRAAPAAGSDWMLPGYVEDPAEQWAASARDFGWNTGIPDAMMIVPANYTDGTATYVRHEFTVPAEVTHASLIVTTTRSFGGPIYLNGTALTPLGTSPPLDTVYWTYDVSARLIPGATNLLALVAVDPYGSAPGIGYRIVRE